jgi:hypothetical protein
VAVIMGTPTRLYLLEATVIPQNNSGFSGPADIHEPGCGEGGLEHVENHESGGYPGSRCGALFAGHTMYGCESVTGFV